MKYVVNTKMRPINSVEMRFIYILHGANEQRFMFGASFKFNVARSSPSTKSKSLAGISACFTQTQHKSVAHKTHDDATMLDGMEFKRGAA